MEKYKLTKKLKRNLKRIIISLVLFIATFITDKIVNLSSVFGGNLSWLFPFAIYLTIYLIIGYDVIIKAVKNIFSGQIFDENFLMCVATLGAFSLAVYRGVNGEATEGFDEACAVLIFYQVGEFFQGYATGKSRKSITGLMDIRPDYANVLRGGETLKVSPAEVEVNETILVNPGEKIPLDGVILSGETTLDTKALTGESLPKEVAVGDEVLSGTVNLSTQITIKVTKAFYDSTVTKILNLVENASSQKSKSENFITKFSKIYTPTVCAAALIIAVIPSIFTGAWQTWIYRALSFLVVSCPCALVISIPLSFFAGLGAASRYGVLIKGSNYLEKFNDANVFYFDKTGTLTKGEFSVVKVTPDNNADEILRLAAICEKDSSHPIAKSIIAKFNDEIPDGYVKTNLPGNGIIAKNGDDVILCGNEKLMKTYGVDFDAETQNGTVVYVAKNGKFVGSIVISDVIKEESKEVIENLSSLSAKTYMLTGDNDSIAKEVSTALNLDGYKASLLPDGKVAVIDDAIRKKGKKDVVCFVGDGINDAPVLMRSDVGIAMGGVGSDAAIEAADVVLMHDDLRNVPLAKKIAKKTMRIVKENVTFSIAVKLIILVLSALGVASMWLAVFGDVGVAVIAILNAMRVNSKYE